MNKPDLALNNLQLLICHKTKPNNFRKYLFLDSCIFIFLFPKF